MRTKRTGQRLRRHLARVALVVLGIAASARGAAPRPLDPRASTLTVRVFKSGFLSALGHDHEIAAPVAGGSLDTAVPSVELHVDARSLRVLDPDLSADKRAQVQRTMEGQVLDVARYPKIRFRSTAIETTGVERWTVHGTLELHGQSHPLVFAVRREGGFYRGTARLRQTDFGIKPVKVAAGAVRVKDEVHVEFRIAIAS